MVLKKHYFLLSRKEGPHSALCDDEFYDAMEIGLDKIEEDNQIKDRLKQKAEVVPTTPTTPAVKHRLWSEVQFYELQKLYDSYLSITHRLHFRLSDQQNNIRAITLRSIGRRSRRLATVC